MNNIQWKVIGLVGLIPKEILKDGNKQAVQSR